MQKILFIFLGFIAAVNMQAQTRTSNNSSLDTLKKNIKAIGNLFKKAGALTVTITGIDSNDNSLASLKQNIQRMPGVKAVKTINEQNKTSLTVSYKGKGADFWQAVPQSSKQKFSLIALSDTLIKLDHKYAQTAALNKTATENSTKKNQQASEPNINTTAVNSNKTRQSTTLSKGALLLFSNVKSNLSDDKKNMIFNDLNFKLSKDSKQFIADAESAEYPFDASVYPTDLNKDGREEIFVLFGNSFTSGMTGSSIIALIADKTGTYKMNLGFPGTLPDALSTSNLGYPDLLIGGPGFEFPVWRWNGKEYDFFKKVKENDLKKLKLQGVEEISKAYTAGIK